MTLPGAHVDEGPGSPPPIAAAPTSVTAFVGRTRRGPTDTPRRVSSAAEFKGAYGGLWDEAPLGHAVTHYFANGGRDAVVARLHHGARPAVASLPTAGGGDLEVVAADEGAWGNELRVRVEAAAPGAFHLHVRDTGTEAEEVHRDLSADPAHPRFVTTALAASALVRARGEVPRGIPIASPLAADPWAAATGFTGGDDGAALADADVSDPALAADHQGLWLLDGTPDLNLLCIPPLGAGVDVGRQTWDAAVAYAAARRAVVLVDPPAGWASARDVERGLAAHVTRHPNAALYVPRVVAPDPLRSGAPAVFAPSGAIAGVIARTDGTRGVWRAPAGPASELRGSTALAWADGSRPIPRDLDALNPLGINTLRVQPGVGPVVWGARTLAGADAAASEWKYLPVRRLALHLAESLGRGLGWTVFEPNDEPLWASVRSTVGAYLDALFRAGAFQGTTSREAYSVRCDRSTTTAADQAAGEFTVLVGFAPLKPAEFVVLTVRGRAGGAA